MQNYVYEHKQILDTSCDISDTMLPNQQQY